MLLPHVRNSHTDTNCVLLITQDPVFRNFVLAGEILATYIFEKFVRAALGKRRARYGDDWPLSVWHESVGVGEKGLGPGGKEGDRFGTIGVKGGDRSFQLMGQREGKAGKGAKGAKGKDHDRWGETGSDPFVGPPTNPDRDIPALWEVSATGVAPTLLQQERAGQEVLSLLLIGSEYDSLGLAFRLYLETLFHLCMSYEALYYQLAGSLVVPLKFLHLVTANPEIFADAVSCFPEQIQLCLRLISFSLYFHTRRNELFLHDMKRVGGFDIVLTLLLRLGETKNYLGLAGRSAHVAAIMVEALQLITNFVILRGFLDPNLPPEKIKRVVSLCVSLNEDRFAEGANKRRGLVEVLGKGGEEGGAEGEEAQGGQGREAKLAAPVVVDDRTDAVLFEKHDVAEQVGSRAGAMVEGSRFRTAVLVRGGSSHFDSVPAV